MAAEKEPIDTLTSATSTRRQRVTLISSGFEALASMPAFAHHRFDASLSERRRLAGRQRFAISFSRRHGGDVIIRFSDGLLSTLREAGP